ncbi:Alpha/Beta hydrolase protein [Schizophyllum amplum]|uniref:Alpha/Beta hydrolase protein n=1 Tax=Schizophyllum amplum TaxID=97359 RepID=A0A550BUF6_9AGAR|nr:Alpha/Beta hydrolase protein [Auriculariopsis ampla]
MPHVSLDTAVGPVDMQYFIATPTENDAQRIDPSRPTVVLIHSTLIGADIFVSQFADPALRQCNLVAPMLRGHGATQGPPLVESYTHQPIADDVALLMRALQLPACHIVGLAVGANVAMELAVAHPDLVASLTLCSPLALHEPEGNIQARKEMCGYWEEAYHKDAQNPDISLIQDAFYGAEQMMFSNRYSDVRSVQAVTKSSMDYASTNWAPEPEKVMSATVSVNQWHSARPRSGRDAWRAFLAKISQPVQIIYFDDDVQYGLPVREELEVAPASSAEEVASSIAEEIAASSNDEVAPASSTDEAAAPSSTEDVVALHKVQGTCYGVLVSAEE